MVDVKAWYLFDKIFYQSFTVKHFALIHKKQHSYFIEKTLLNYDFLLE